MRSRYSPFAMNLTIAKTYQMKDDTAGKKGK